MADNFWADEAHVEKLLELNDQGLSATQISRGLGGAVSRNSVIGKLNRLGVRLMGHSTGGETVRVRAIVRKRTAPNPAVVKEAPAPVIEEPPITLADGCHVTILTVTDRMCRWPIGDPADSEFHFCGRSPKSGAPYCEAHCRRAYTPALTAASNKKAAEKEVEKADRTMRRAWA